ncbi:Spc98 family-domain-containing protein [Biscogniauxia sp. FL1348]|nr:Spc98 family-domain-containing protein [Biscogniauxia sp. FL1348]
MVDAEDPADVFAFPDFEQSSKLLDFASQSIGNPFFNTSNLDASTRSPEHSICFKPIGVDVAVDGLLGLPASLRAEIGLHENETEDGGETPVPGPIPGPGPGSETLHDTTVLDFDFFADALSRSEEAPPPAGIVLKTWDDFSIPDAPPSGAQFITESSPAVYDAALKLDEDPLVIRNAAHHVVRASPYLAALLVLTLGRGSVFFVWDEKKACFAPDLENMRVSGYSAQVLKGLQDRCLECGTATRFLSAHIQTTYRTHPSAVSVALARAIDVVLLAIQKHLGDRGSQVRSLLQFQSLIQPVRSILVYFRRLVSKLSHQNTDEQTLSIIFEETQALAQGDSLLSIAMREVLSRVSEPWTNLAERWIGVRAEEGIRITKEGPGWGFIRVAQVTTTDDSGFEIEELDYVLDQDRMPTFIRYDMALVMFEAGKNLRLLQTHHPDHPLCNPETIALSCPPALRWHFDWKSIEEFQEEVRKYERRLLEKTQDQTSNVNQRIGPDTRKANDNGALQFFGCDVAQLEGRISASIKVLDSAPTPVSKEDDLSSLLRDRLFEDGNVSGETTTDFSPHWSLIPINSFGPLVTAQARVINREYMRLLFRAHGLREHLHVQKEFQLLGNGFFCSRLSHALFDPDLETAERQAGVARNGGTMGLRLGGRDSWPPASSELRLALMGVLNESYLPQSSSHESVPTIEGRSLPGDLSFAVRDLSPEEIDKCLDPNSLEALDFLRLSYKTPAPLKPVIPAVVLIKYDKIFRLLLRILRLLYIVGQLCRDTTTSTYEHRCVGNTWLRFRFEAQHFITSISAYFFEVGIDTPWRQFEKWLDGIESNVMDDGLDLRETRVLSPDELREEHERVLDRVMHGLLLRKRQQPVMKLLEEIFHLVIKFSHQARLETTGKVEGNAGDEVIRGLYVSFKKKVDVFITVCRSLIEKGGHGSKEPRRDMFNDERRTGDDFEENTIDRLLIRLDMLGHYHPPSRT